MLTIKASGKISKGDYEGLEGAIGQKLSGRAGTLNVMFDVEGVEGIEPSALTADLSSGLKSRNAFDRVAVVGASGAQELATKIASSLFDGTIRNFGEDERASAQQWVDS